MFELSFRVQIGSRTLVVDLASAAQAVAVFGPSGGGKSTLLRTLAGVDRRARGVVGVRGVRWLDSEGEVFLPPWERGVGWVPQDHLLFPHLRVRENLGFGGASDEAVRVLAERLQVEGLLDRRPRSLSGGEQQRVALGRALLSDPGLLLLDEPFSALDRPLRSRMVALLREFLQATGTPLVLVSHDEADAVSLGQEHWLLSHGRLERVE